MKKIRLAARWLPRALLVVVALFFVARAARELVSVDPADPASYRHDWGGPHYLGVLLVHVGPGLLVVALAFLWWRRRSGGSK